MSVLRYKGQEQAAMIAEDIIGPEYCLPRNMIPCIRRQVMMKISMRINYLAHSREVERRRNDPRYSDTPGWTVVPGEDGHLYWENYRTRQRSLLYHQTEGIIATQPPANDQEEVQEQDDEQSEDEAIDDRVPRQGNNNHVDCYEPLPILQNEQEETYAEIFQEHNVTHRYVFCAPGDTRRNVAKVHETDWNHLTPRIVQKLLHPETDPINENQMLDLSNHRKKNPYVQRSGEWFLSPYFRDQIFNMLYSIFEDMEEYESWHFPGFFDEDQDKQYHIVFPQLGPHVGNTDGLTRDNSIFHQAKEVIMPPIKLYEVTEDSEGDYWQYDLNNPIYQQTNNNNMTFIRANQIALIEERGMITTSLQVKDKAAEAEPIVRNELIQTESLECKEEEVQTEIVHMNSLSHVSALVLPTIQVQIEDGTLDFLVDTGSSVSIVKEDNTTSGRKKKANITSSEWNFRGCPRNGNVKCHTPRQFISP